MTPGRTSFTLEGTSFAGGLTPGRWGRGQGDWKLSGFGLSQNLFSPEGAPAKWEFPTYDPALPPSCQRNYDYIGAFMQQK